MFDTTTLILTSIFGLFGMAFFVYGKRETDLPFLCAGALLMVYPFFISGAFLVFLIGAILTAAPFAMRYMGN
ncbi:hypothetical protein LLG95_10490 [bacterium]|nr:hypothetical protein [bacterium]